MKGVFSEPNKYNKEMLSCVRFIFRKGKYTFISSLFYWHFPEEDSYPEEEFTTGRFDFKFNNSNALTNKGIKSINKYAVYAIQCIDKLFDLGCRHVEIAADEYKENKRLMLYERILSRYYDIKYVRSYMFIITKK